jgi:hypothetical protein
MVPAVCNVVHTAYNVQCMQLIPLVPTVKEYVLLCGSVRTELKVIVVSRGLITRV